MSARARTVMLVLAFCFLVLGAFPFVRDAVSDDEVRTQPAPDRGWVYSLLAVCVVAILVGAFAWRRDRVADWPATMVLVAVCVAAAGAAILLVPEKDIVSRAAELGYVVVNAPAGDAVRYGPDVRWGAIPFAAGVGLLVSVAVAWLRQRVRGQRGQS